MFPPKAFKGRKIFIQIIPRKKYIMLSENIEFKKTQSCFLMLVIEPCKLDQLKKIYNELHLSVGIQTIFLNSRHM